jgi:hypothetical protein
MPMWRCPHCGTPQAEAARCWVCHRSTSSCASCRNFRRSITAGVGYCSRDRGRAALDGQEIRPCWEPVVALQDSRLAAPELIGREDPAGSDRDAGRFWRDAER